MRTPPRSAGLLSSLSATKRIRGGPPPGATRLLLTVPALRPPPRAGWRIRHCCYSTGTFVILLGVSLLQLRLSLLHHATVDYLYPPHDDAVPTQGAAVLWSTFTANATRPPIQPRPQMADTRDLYTRKEETREGIVNRMRNSRVVVLQPYTQDEGGDESPRDDSRSTTTQCRTALQAVPYL